MKMLAMAGLIFMGVLSACGNQDDDSVKPMDQNDNAKDTVK